MRTLGERPWPAIAIGHDQLQLSWVRGVLGPSKPGNAQSSAAGKGRQEHDTMHEAARTAL